MNSPKTVAVLSTTLLYFKFVSVPMAKVMLISAHPTLVMGCTITPNVSN